MNFESVSAVFVLFAGIAAAVFGFLQVRNSDAGNAIKAMAGAVAELSTRISVLETERTALTHRIDELENALQDKEMSTKALVFRISEMEKSIEEKEDEIVRLTVRVSELETENSRLSLLLSGA